MSKILILGGYGNFGKRISIALAKDDIPIIIAGRNEEKARQLAGELNTEFAVFDVNKDLGTQLKQLKPKAVINTCGPFQDADYSIAKICIANGVHYLDLSDARDFVVGITELDEAAKKAGVLVVSGASSVPGLSSAVMEKYKDEFSEIDYLKFGISPGQKADRGLATTQAILTYLGKPLKPSYGSEKIRYGWGDTYCQEYPEIGKRWVANCDIPDMDLLPQKYGIKEIKFSAGFENRFLHFGTSFAAWLVRIGLPLNLPKFAKPLLTISHWFDIFGSSDGAMHMIISGKDKERNPYQRKWFIIAKDGDGPQIPCIPAVILAKKLCSTEFYDTGAKACLGMISIEEYMHELSEFNIQIVTNKVLST